MLPMGTPRDPAFFSFCFVFSLLSGTGYEQRVGSFG
ncbi:hypothetical protein CPLU01_12602 [Colletotrichum plurivorum]|uniref:Uncharacterized protein n=1 Tax=Colletotrichum plurivorum TaxID=2175906 RepID=A0A8H6N6D0_9PEZI|nr:hypothetical protein CPLU01_12602 [Colletotrichum plurivorum]